MQENHPEDVVARNGYAEILKAEGDLEGAKRIYLEVQETYSHDLYSKHALLVCRLINEEYNPIDFVTSNPKTINDYYFYHSYVMYNIRIKEYSLAEELIVKEIDRTPFYKTKILFEQTYIYLRILRKKSKGLLSKFFDFNVVQGDGLVYNILQTHVYAENGMKDKAVNCLKKYKYFPSNSVFYTTAALLSERYGLNGMPVKGLDDVILDQLIYEEEFKVIGMFV